MCGILLHYNSDVNIILQHFIISLSKIQHRGQDSSGILFKNNGTFKTITSNGLVDKLLHIDFDFSSNICLGHLRYKTSGYTLEHGVQPILSENNLGKYGLVFNGNIPIHTYRHKFSRSFQLDTDMLVYFINQQACLHTSWVDILSAVINTFERAFSIIIVTSNNIYTITDIYGVRPLSYNLDTSRTFLQISSESVVYNDTKSGVTIDRGLVMVFNIDSSIIKPEIIYNFYNDTQIIKQSGGKCIFEFIYFQSHNTMWDSICTDKIREQWAIQLAQKDIESNTFTTNRNDYVIVGIPSTGIIPGKAYAETIKLEYRQVVTKNKGSKRTFILKDGERQTASKNKYVYDIEQIKDKHIIVIDDSIVRGITIKNIVESLKYNGAKEIHLRINSPAIRDICMYGIDIPEKNTLIANNKSIPDIIKEFGCTSLNYLEIDDMLNEIDTPTEYCTGCFNSDYGEIAYRKKYMSDKNEEYINLSW